MATKRHHEKHKATHTKKHHKKRGMKKGTVCVSPADRRKLRHSHFAISAIDKAIKALRTGKAKIHKAA